MENNKHLVRVGHEFAAAMSDNTPIITIAKMVTELASALDVQTARSEALAAENAALKSFLGECLVPKSEGNWTGNGEKTVYVSAVNWMPPTPATEAFLAEIRAQGVEGIYQFNTDKVGVYLDGDVCGLIDCYVAQLRSNSNGGAV